MKLRVLSWNVHGLRDDQRELRSVVREVEPDVAVLQEAPRRLRWRTRCAILANELDLVYAAGGGPGLGNLILVDHRVRVHEVRYLRFDLVPGHHLRGAALVRASAGRVPFVVAGSHLSTEPVRRLIQAEKLAETLAGAGTPVILGIDVNEPPGGPAWQALADGRLDAGGSPTFPSVDPVRRIDAVLVDAGVRVERGETVDTVRARRASDHLPIVADLVLPDPDPEPVRD